VTDPHRIDVRTAESANAQGGDIDAAIAPCKTWVLVEGRYNDRWSTPMAGAEFRLWVNNAVVLEREQLKDYESLGLIRGRAPSTDSELELYEQLGTFLYRNCDTGQARAEILRDPSEESGIQELRNTVEARLDGAYRALKEAMAPYQAQWDEWGYISILLAYEQGQGESAEEWIKSLGDLFTAKYWVEIGEAIGSGISKTLDTAEVTIGEASKKIADAYDKREVLLQSAWWSARVDGAIQVAEDTASKTQELLVEGAQLVQRSSRVAQAIYRHRTAILNLPDRVVAGDVNAIEEFIDTALEEIDPAMAASLRYDSTWQSTIELLHDGEAAAIFSVYLDLFITVAPPNYWAHAFGRAAFYVMIEIVLVVLGLLLGGAGAAARVGMITARLARMGGTVAKIGKMADKALDAMRAAQRMINAFEDAVTDINKLKRKLLRARRRSVQRGGTGSSLKHRRDTQDRDGRCRVCGSKSHNTPLHRRGQVDYR
jgi:hypothetical protein